MTHPANLDVDHVPHAAGMRQACPIGSGFIQALLAAASAADPRQQVEAVLRQWAGERVYLPRTPLQRTEPAADLAQRLIFGGVGARAAAELLRLRRGLSARHARRLVRAAVAMRGQRMAVLPCTMHGMTNFKG